MSKIGEKSKSKEDLDKAATKRKVEQLEEEVQRFRTGQHANRETGGQVQDAVLSTEQRVNEGSGGGEDERGHVAEQEVQHRC